MHPILASLPKYRRPLLLLSVGLYISSLMLPVFYFKEPRHPLMGYEVLAQGMWGILLLEPRWYANLFYFYGLARQSMRKVAHKSANIAMILGVSSFIFPIYYYPNEAVAFLVTTLGIGAYFWLASILIIYLVSIIDKSAPNPPLNTDAPQSGTPVS